jgi:hypothetical protein
VNIGAKSSAVLLLAAPAFAAQVVLTDAHYTHLASDGSHHYGAVVLQQPPDWTKPDDFAHGEVYFHVEIIAKPSTQPVKYGVCFIQDKGSSYEYACSFHLTFSATGVYEWHEPLTGFFQYSLMNWATPIRTTNGIPFILRDMNDTKIDTGNSFIGAPSTAAYFPMEARWKITLVSAGSTYVPDPDAGTPPTADAGTPRDAGSMSHDAGDASPDAGPPPPDLMQSELTPDSGTDTHPPMQPPPDPTPVPAGPLEGGCQSSGAGQWAFAALFAAAAMRRTRDKRRPQR